jgi:hypothetical protein
MKMPSWLPGARFKRFAREWYPIAVGARKTPIDKVKRELVSVTGSPFFVASNIIYLGSGSGSSICRHKNHIEPP